MPIIDLIVNEKNLLSATLNEMKRLERISVSNGSFRLFVLNTFQLTSQLFHNLWQWLRQCNYISDHPFDEILIAPHLFMNLQTGDCDDYSLFAHAVLSVLGFNPKYILLGKRKNDYSHIAVYCNGIIIDGCNEIYNDIPPSYQFKEIV